MRRSGVVQTKAKRRLQAILVPVSATVYVRARLNTAGSFPRCRIACDQAKARTVRCAVHGVVSDTLPLRVGRYPAAC